MSKKIDLDEFKGLELRSSGKEVEEITLFTLDDVEYKIPVSVGYNVTVQATEVYATRGPEAASLWALETLVGPKGWEALKQFDDLTEEEFETILQVCEKIVKGSGKKRRSVSELGGN